MTLLCYLLNKFCRDVCSTQEKNAVKQLRGLRNPLMHVSSDNIDDDDFETLWKRGSDAVRVLLPSADAEMERLKTGPLVEGAEEDETYLKLQYEEEEKYGMLQMEMWERKLTQQSEKTKNLDRRMRGLETLIANKGKKRNQLSSQPLFKQNWIQMTRFPFPTFGKQIRGSLQKWNQRRQRILGTTSARDN